MKKKKKKNERIKTGNLAAPVASQLLCLSWRTEQQQLITADLLTVTTARHCVNFSSTTRFCCWDIVFKNQSRWLQVSIVALHPGWRWVHEKSVLSPPAHLPTCCCPALIACICSSCRCLRRDNFRLPAATQLHIEYKHNKFGAACAV